MPLLVVEAAVSQEGWWSYHGSCARLDMVVVKTIVVMQTSRSREKKKTRVVEVDDRKVVLDFAK
jgi:hypothetical protein